MSSKTYAQCHVKPPNVKVTLIIINCSCSPNSFLQHKITVIFVKNGSENKIYDNVNEPIPKPLYNSTHTLLTYVGL